MDAPGPLNAIATLAAARSRWRVIGLDGARLWQRVDAHRDRWQSHRPHQVVINTADPIEAIAGVVAALSVPTQLWLASPTWGDREWQQFAAHCPTVDAVIGNSPPISLPPTDAAKPGCDRSRLRIPTGGSSGDLRFACHTWETLSTAVAGFQRHFQTATVNAYCVLPLHHVSGLMQALRSLIGGGTLTVQSFRDLMMNGPLAAAPAGGFLSLVPTQLQRLLDRDPPLTPWLQRFDAILLGGAPAWPSLLVRSRAAALPLAPTYGMTETAAQVATLLPAEFLAGRNGSGRPLPHVHLTICDSYGQAVAPGTVGQIAIATHALAVNLQSKSETAWQPGDLGWLDAAGYLHVVGRHNQLIITGGEKVHPPEVEAALMATGQVSDAVVLGIPDQEWGERVVAVVAPVLMPDAIATLRAELRSQLSPHKIPKVWLSRPSLPRNAQGKLNRAALRQWVMAQPTAATSP